MIQRLFPKIIGGKNEREVNRIRPTVARINEIEGALQREPDEKLLLLTRDWQSHLARYHPLDAPPRSAIERMDEQALTDTADAIEARFSLLRKEFSGLPASIAPNPKSIEAAKSAFAGIEEKFVKSRARYLDRILPEAYAVVKNAARRLCGSEILVSGQAMKWQMVHFDVQLIGGIALHRGLIAEMQTGEGKTLVATLPVYLNALAGLGVHVVTVNDYLAQRDSEWMGALFRFLGLTVGCIQSQMPSDLRFESYACDITYGTNSEFGFDYLRDNGMAISREEQVQRSHYLAIIDEVDSILIDDARTPLIISGEGSHDSYQFGIWKPVVEKLVRRQTELCNRIATEVEQALADGDTAAAGTGLLKLKHGQPRNRRFMRFMEDPEIRRLLEKFELSHQQGPFGNKVFKLKEELYFVVDEKLQDADLMEKGRLFLSPNDPDTFTLPDMASRIARIEADDGLTPEEKSVERLTVQQQLDVQGGKIHGISQLLKAYCLYERDVHYVVRGDKVTIIDESTGREMAGRRWSSGLHQAVEAKENVSMEKETSTYATITIQNYFRLYEKLAGMTGTAETEAAEFHDIYRLDVLPIPTNAANLRIDENDQIFKTRREKYNAVVSRIEEAHAIGQPILVGTASVDSSETLSRMLKRARIEHAVLNAKHHEEEAAIVALAGQKGAVTVSTNMAGRGTDIKLGEGVDGLGGLFVIATERHPSRRVDRQLRGRCSRQGDPGRSQFFVSFEDELMRNYAAPDRMAALIERSRKIDGKNSKLPSLGKLVETAQRQVEQRDYKSRKRVLDFDDVMNLQREIVYGYRNEVLCTEDIRQLIDDLVLEIITGGVGLHLGRLHRYEPDYSELLHWIHTNLQIGTTEAEVADLDGKGLIFLLGEKVKEAYEARIHDLPSEAMEQEQRRMVLMAIDRKWQEHLESMDELREGVYLRSQGQKDPLVEFKNEAYGLFVSLMDTIRRDSLHNLFRSATGMADFLAQLQTRPSEGGGLELKMPPKPASTIAANPGRNDACHCGTGRKYKHCCGRMV
ncbi:preprotein translocase subunit SecA [Luteolibacter sp. AS25]|uniref:preprotein translocase subunit SecA n=1 Tax=Luteolibacter sp. AS25 TaxID=3135776 RepID=UPI00398A8CA4